MNTSHISIGPQGTTSRKTARGQLLFERLIRFATGWGLPERLVRRGQSVACIFLLLSLMTLCVNTATAQGALTNGWTHTGTISPVGHSDSWTFSANVGDSIVIRVGEITQTNSFTPRIRLLNPIPTQQASASGSIAAEIAVTATNTGTFTVIVDDAFGTTATGTYRLTLAKSAGAIFVAPGDEGGPMTNGVMHTGTIDVGDLDVWTFSASSGDALVVRMGEVVDSSGNFDPWIRLYSPGGKLLSSSFGVLAAEVTATATNSGTFIVVVGDGNSALSGTGNYRLTLAKTGDPVVVSAGDDGGPMTNGVMHMGTISTGDLDLWTFNANSGDALVVRMGEIVDSSGNFDPWVRLYGPNGKLLDSSFGVLAAEVTATATNGGTYIVVVGDGNSSLSGTGNYRLTLAKTGDPVVVSAGDDGGPMTNGVMHTGTISTGDLDQWTFNANSGDALLVRIGEVVDSSGNFDPWIRLYSPGGKLLGSSFGVSAAEVTVTATNSGTFIVVVGDGNSALSGTGDYRLTLAKTGDPVVVSAGDDGGPMTNGVMHMGTISTGDLDLWTFSANSGDALLVRIGEVVDSSGNFDPWIRLYSPGGKLLGSSFGVSAAEVTVTATNSGTFIVVVGDGNSALSGSGDYRLTLAKTGDPVVVSAGDDGGPMTNGVMHMGTISTGDLDLWTFNANSGDAIIVRMGEIVDASGNFEPWVRLYGPNGKLLDSSFGVSAAEVTATATNGGTFIVVVGDGNSALSGSGDYRLTLAKTGDPVVVSAGDNGGPMTNGVMHTGTISTGDLDLWTFNANSGDAIIVRMGEITRTNAFTPWVRLYGPNGKLLGSGFGTAAGEVAVTATNSGTFIAVVGDGNSSLSGSGDYRVTLAKTGDPVMVSAGDEGGTLIGSGTYDGTIDVGDLDLWTFTACAGDGILLRMDELVSGSSLTPWIRLYGRDGTLLNSVFGAATAQINRSAPVTGRYLVVVGDGTGGLGGSGTYRLTVDGLTDELKVCVPVISGTNAKLGGVGGITNAVFRLDTTTNLATPAALWTPILTNYFDVFGTFTYTNPFSRTEPARFFRLSDP
jgi:trimeric autotransporter adhesin